MENRNSDKYFESEIDSLKIYFDEVEWNNLSSYEKQELLRDKRNYECLVEIDVNFPLPKFMRKKRINAAGCSQTNAKTSAANVLNEKHHEKKVPHTDYSSLSWSEDNIELIQSDHTNIEVFLKGVMINEEQLNRPKPGDASNYDSNGPLDKELCWRYPRRNIPQAFYEAEDVFFDDNLICDIKSCLQERNFAPSSSMIRQHDSAQQYPQKRKEIFMDQVLSYSTTSCAIPSSLKVCQTSQDSELPNGRIREILIETGITNKLTTDETGEIDSAVGESMPANIQGKPIADTKNVLAKSHACPYCDYKTCKSVDLRKHVNAVHEGQRPHKCQQCDYRATDNTHLIRHVREVHERRKPYKCQQCDYEATRFDNLQKHVNAVHERLKPYKCGKCHYRASETGSLRKHITVVHEGIRPHLCPHCDYKAAQAINLRNHVNAVHDKKKPYFCQHCDYKASQVANLRRHVKKIHSGKKDPEMPQR